MCLSRRKGREGGGTNGGSFFYFFSFKLRFTREDSRRWEFPISEEIWREKKEGRVGGAEPPNIIRASETCAFVKCHDSQKHVRHIASYPLPLPPLWSLFLFFCYFLFLFTQVSSIKRGRVMQRELTCLLLLVANSFQMTSTTTPKTARNLYNWMYLTSMINVYSI